MSAQIGVWKIFKNLKVTSKVVTAGLLYAVRACVQFFRNRSKEGSCKGQKDQNIWKFGEKRTKFESVLKKSRQLIVCN